MKNDDETVEAIKDAVGQIPGMRLMTEEETASFFAGMPSVEEIDAKSNAAVAAAGVPDEKALRDAESPWPKSPEELAAYIAALVDRPHTYGSCVYAMSLAAVATFNYVAHRLGTTGFQSGCADFDILRRTRRFEWGKLLNYANLLYPQYLTEEHFPSLGRILEANRDELAKQAAAKLETDGDRAHPNVVAHWRWLVSRCSEPTEGGS